MALHPFWDGGHWGRGRELTSVWPYAPSGMEGTGGSGRELTSVWPYIPSGMEGIGGEVGN